MKVEKKFLALSTLFGGSVFAINLGGIDINSYVAPYITYIKYDGSAVKKDGWVTTLYGSLSFQKGVHVLEWAYGYTHLNYKGSPPSGWNQNDYTLKYTNYQFFPFYGSVGFHYIASPNTDISERAYIWLADIGYIKKYDWTTGVEAAYSDYKYGFNAKQLRIHGGKYLWLGYRRGFYFEGSLYAENVNKKYVTAAGWAQNTELNKKNFYWLGYGITYFTPKYTVKLNSQIGERAFEVDNGGFVVYNLKERYYSSTSLSGTYRFSKRLSATLQVGMSSYREVETDKRVKVYTVTASVGYSF